MREDKGEPYDITKDISFTDDECDFIPTPLTIWERMGYVVEAHTLRGLITRWWFQRRGIEHDRWCTCPECVEASRRARSKRAHTST